MHTILQTIVWLIVPWVIEPAASPAGTPPFPREPDLAGKPHWKVIAVDSADCIVVAQGDAKAKVRLAAVQPGGPDAAFPPCGRTFLRNLLLGEEVWLVPEAVSGDPTREPCYVYRWPDRLFVNLELLRQGYADLRADLKAASDAVRSFRYWRDRARRAGKGIWQKPSPTSGKKPAGQEAAPTQDGRDVTVYVTRRGRKYHRADCVYVRKGGRALPLSEARKRYEPCKICKPPK